MDRPQDRPDASAPKDGEMDFTGYSETQLRALRLHIDAKGFPRSFERLEAEIFRRESDGQRIPVRFTRLDGFAGWLQALLSLQPFYGSGSITPRLDEVLVEGLQRTWLGMSQQAEIAIAAPRIRNAYYDQEWVSFDVKRRFWWSRRYVVRATDADTASILVALLPAARSKWFEKQAADIRNFYRLLRMPGRRPWLTPLIVLACVVIYFAQAAISGYWLGLDGLTLVNWGANVGGRTVHGEWWRLLAAMFLHANILHLAVNMWVLWSAGRLTESLFGNRAYAIIYFVAGLMGGLLSIAWSPAVSSVGASGAIFGILGAFIAYLLHGDTKVPRRVMRAHLIPTLLFTLFNILNGLGQTGIDNAAHVGGLLTGLLLGWAFATPMTRRASPLLLAQSAAAILLTVSCAAGLLLQVTGPASKPGAAEQLLAANDWYRNGEAGNLLRWQEIASRAATGTIASGDLARQFEKEIEPFWKDAAPRLRRLIPTLPQPARPFGTALADFADMRLGWAQAIVSAARDNNSSDAVAMMEKTDTAQARIDWFNLRTEYDHLAHAFSESPPVVQLANLAWFNYHPCVKYPFIDFNAVAPNDLASDGPARRLAQQCLAQKLFLTRDFTGLEAAFEQARYHPDDLADGTSSYEALGAGLSDLLQYGGLDVDAVMVRLSEWRQAVPGSVHSDMTEVSALIAWAYAARGIGTADTITAQNQMIFLHRIKIAAVALNAMETRGRKIPDWYAESISVNLFGNGKEEERRAIFDQGHALFPDDMNVDSAMLHSLMPRWGASFQKVAQFIAEQAREPQKRMPDVEKYSRLYWSYMALEGEQMDIFRDAYAKPELISLGMAVAMRRYPKSDYLVNIAGRLACQSDQRLEYLVFHNSMPKHYSASAWSPNVTLDSCNRKFGLKP